MYIAATIAIIVLYITVFIIGCIYGYYERDIRICDKRLKIIREKWEPMITNDAVEDPYQLGQLDGINLAFSWMQEEDC